MLLVARSQLSIERLSLLLCLVQLAIRFLMGVKSITKRLSLLGKR
ncbi:hypothetical protein [Neptunomonas marina]|nr:hypothetical protein [Neptunomonas marina]